MLAGFDRITEENEHFEFFVFPTRTALTLIRNRTDQPPPCSQADRFLGDVVVENGLRDLALRLTGRFRSGHPKMARFSTGFMSQSEQIDVSHRVFATTGRSLQRDGIRAPGRAWARLSTGYWS